MLSILLFCSCPYYSGLSKCWSFSDNAWSLLVQLLTLAACQKTGSDLPECILGVWGGLTCITFLGLKSRLSWTWWLQTWNSLSCRFWRPETSSQGVGRTARCQRLCRKICGLLLLVSDGFGNSWTWFLPFHLSLLPCLQGSGSLSLNLVAARITVDKCFLKSFITPFAPYWAKDLKLHLAGNCRTVLW